MEDYINEEGRTVCGKCGHVFQSGDWPFCPHPPATGPRRDGLSSYIPDEIPGGLTLENVGPEPVTVYSYTEMNQLFESRGLTRKEKFCPTPGTSRDPAGVQDPRRYMDPQTLANATELILRAQGAIAEGEKKAAEDKAWADKAFRPKEMVLTEREAQPYFDELAKRR